MKSKHTTFVLLAILSVSLILNANTYFNSSIFKIKEGSETYTASTSHNMRHESVEVDKSILTPTVYLDVIKDAKSGYNLHITFSNYKVTPDLVNTEPIQGQGHTHILINGKKFSRNYAEWVHIPDDFFMKGENKIEITLNANDHSEWVVDGKTINIEKTIIKN